MKRTGFIDSLLCLPKCQHVMKSMVPSRVLFGVGGEVMPVSHMLTMSLAVLITSDA